MDARKLVPLVALAASNCMLLSGRCIYEIRSLEALGRIEENGAELLSARITLSERRDSDPEKSIYWLLRGATLEGHVLSATFKDVSDPSRVLLSLPLSPSGQGKISEGAVSDRSGTNLNGFFEVIAAGRGIIELQTDIQARPTITLPLTVTQRQDWTRPYCS
jgi:hypothetical protein